MTLLAANLAVAPRSGSRSSSTPTAADLEREALARGRTRTSIVMAAAVADYRAGRADRRQAAEGRRALVVELVPTADVARALGARRRDGQVLVAFGAENGADGLERKRRMLRDKNADLVVYNDVGRDDIGFDSADNEVVLVTRDGERRVSEGVQGRDRGGDPRRGRAAPRGAR